MPLIRPRTRGKHFVRLVTRLERDNHATLQAYAQFLAEMSAPEHVDGPIKPEAIEYVINEVIETVLARDKEFAQWRADHPETGVPTFAGRRRRRRVSVRSVPHDTTAARAAS